MCVIELALEGHAGTSLTRPLFVKYFQQRSYIQDGWEVGEEPENITLYLCSCMGGQRDSVSADVFNFCFVFQQLALYKATLNGPELLLFFFFKLSILTSFLVDNSWLSNFLCPVCLLMVICSTAIFYFLGWLEESVAGMCLFKVNLHFLLEWKTDISFCNL